MSSQLRKIYSGLLQKVRLWVAIGVIATMYRRDRQPMNVEAYLLDAMGPVSSKLHYSLYNCSC